jgi:hypothetical protein
VLSGWTAGSEVDEDGDVAGVGAVVGLEDMNSSLAGFALVLPVSCKASLACCGSEI